MTPQVESLFYRLVEFTAQQRSEYYTSHGVEDAVRTEVERLLSFDKEVDSVEEAIGDVARRTADDLRFSQGMRCGPYRLLSLLGEGGMGTVYRAERADGEIAQQVAIKMLHPGKGRAALHERFLQERQLLAQLNHPSIARVFDAGHTEDGWPYLVMEYVDGAPIDQFASGKSIEENVALMVEVCDAVTHAHRHLIIHRDLKPSNILVDASGRVKLLDFGIAKLLDGSGLHTATLDRMLTPAYASPEQIRGDVQTTATDVYSLGAILYKLLTGRSPHESRESGHLALEIAAGVSDVVPPRRLDAKVSADLNCIATKALDREPGRRYSSVESLAADLRRFLSHRPVAARPETLFYRTSRFVRRNGVAVTLAGIAVITGLAGLASTLIQAQEARVQRDFAVRQLAKAEEIGDLNAFLLSDVAPQGKPFMVKDLLLGAERIADSQASDPANRAWILTSIGGQYLSLEEDNKSRELLERAYTLSRSVSDASIRARAGCGLAKALPASSDTARANSLIQESLNQLPSGALYALDRVYCLQSSAEIQRHAGAGEAAVASINSALETLKLAPYYARTRQLSLLLDLAESYRVAGKLRESVGTSEEAARLMESMGRGETQRAGTLFNNWGLTLNLMGRQLEAEKIFRRAIEIGSSDANQGNVSAMLLLNYGRVLGDLGRHREADGFTRRAYADSKRSGMDVVVAQSRIVQASVSRELGDISEAERAIDEFDSLCRRVFPPGHAAFASLASQRSLNAQARGDRVKAVKLANEAVALNEALIRERGEARDFLPMLLQRRSEIRYNAADIEGALADARRAAEMFEKLAQPGSHSSQLGRTYLALGRALDRKQSGVEACLYLHKAGDHLRHSLGSEHPLTFEAVRLSCR